MEKNIFFSYSVEPTSKGFQVLGYDQDRDPFVICYTTEKKLADHLVDHFDNLAMDEEEALFDKPSGLKCKTCDNGLQEGEYEQEQCWDCAKIEQVVDSIKETLGEYILTDYQKDQVRKEVFS